MEHSVCACCVYNMCVLYNHVNSCTFHAFFATTFRPNMQTIVTATCLYLYVQHELPELQKLRASCCLFNSKFPRGAYYVMYAVMVVGRLCYILSVHAVCIMCVFCTIMLTLVHFTLSRISRIKHLYAYLKHLLPNVKISTRRSMPVEKSRTTVLSARQERILCHFDKNL